MPLINPEEAIRSSFKTLKRKRGSSAAPSPPPLKQEVGSPIPTVPINEPVVRLEELKKDDVVKLVPHPKAEEPKYRVEEILLRKESSRSLFSSKQSESGNASRGGDSISSHTVYIVEESRRKRTTDGESSENPELKRKASGGSTHSRSEIPNKPDKNEGKAGRGNEEEDQMSRRKFKAHIIGKKRGPDDDRRRTSWIPCTCPQYKVSNQLATRKDVQGVFFAKVMMVKVIQLLIINIITFSVGLERAKTRQHFVDSHDWAYLAYGFFVALLLTLRVTLSYRARWPIWVAVVLMIPLTGVISYTTACITVVYNSILIPMVTCTVLLTFMMLCFTPYLLRRHVMDRSTNCAAASLALLSSIMLLFLKELEAKPITYWDFVSHVWLPALLLSQIVIQVTVFEIQRMLFGLCFNVSSTRWHIAALYI